MEDIDMSRPGYEMFPDVSQTQYTSYADVNQDQVVADPLDMGVKQESGAASQVGMSDKELNFRALREEASKLKEEREYWKGQAEAYSRQNQRPPEREEHKDLEIDWEDSQGVKMAWESLRRENENLRREIKDAISAVETKAQHSDWNNMVTQHVPQLTSKNPIFAEMIQKASNPYEAAYLLAELNAKASQTAPAQQPSYPSENGQRAMMNAQKPQTLSSIGGRGNLSSADYYATMSDEDFMKIAAKNLANI